MQYSGFRKCFYFCLELAAYYQKPWTLHLKCNQFFMETTAKDYVSKTYNIYLHTYPSAVCVESVARLLDCLLKHGQRD